MAGYAQVVTQLHNISTSLPWSSCTSSYYIMHFIIPFSYPVLWLVVCNPRFSLKNGTMEKRQFAIIVVLTAVVWLLGDFWMSQTKYTYARAHIFLFPPIVLLFLVPPGLLSKSKLTVRFVAYVILFLFCVVAVPYSVLTWGRVLWSKGAVFLGVSSILESYGSVLKFNVPYEVAVWCINHTLFVGFWVMSIWRADRPVPKTRGSSLLGFRFMAAVACLAIAYYGYTLLGKEPKYFYLAVQLMWIFPVLGLQYFLGGHLLVPYAREYVLGIIVPSAYITGIDMWATYRNVWGVTEELVVGAAVSGLVFEQELVYVLTTTLVVHGVIAALRLTEIYLAIRPLVKSFCLKVFLLAFLWGED